MFNQNEFEKLKNYCNILDNSKRIIDSMTENSSDKIEMYRIYNNAFIGLIKNGYPINIRGADENKVLSIIIDEKAYNCDFKILKKQLKKEIYTLLNDKSSINMISSNPDSDRQTDIPSNNTYAKDIDVKENKKQDLYDEKQNDVQEAKIEIIEEKTEVKKEEIEDNKYNNPDKNIPKYVWTKDDDDILRKYYPTEGYMVRDRLPDKSSGAISKRTKQLGIRYIKPEDRNVEEIVEATIEMDIIDENSNVKAKEDNNTYKEKEPENTRNNILESSADTEEKVPNNIETQKEEFDSPSIKNDSVDSKTKEDIHPESFEIDNQSTDDNKKEFSLDKMFFDEYQITISKENYEKDLMMRIFPLKKETDKVSTPIAVCIKMDGNYKLFKSSNERPSVEVDMNDYQFIVRGAWKDGEFSSTIYPRGMLIEDEYEVDKQITVNRPDVFDEYNIKLECEDFTISIFPMENDNTDSNGMADVLMCTDEPVEQVIVPTVSSNVLEFNTSSGRKNLVAYWNQDKLTVEINN